MSECPFYKNLCVLKSQANLPDFKKEHDCQGILKKCSFFVEEPLKQIKVNSKLKIIIKRVDNVYLVKADGLVYPTNNLLDIDDPLLNRMTLNEAQQKCTEFVKKQIKMGYPYAFKVPPHWKIKQKYFINAVVAGESRLVNEFDVSNAMKKTILYAEQMGLENLLILPCDNGSHDISLTSMAQLSAIFTISKKHEFKHLKYIYICMEDEESERAFIEYFNRIFGGNHEQRNESDSSINS